MIDGWRSSNDEYYHSFSSTGVFSQLIPLFACTDKYYSQGGEKLLQQHDDAKVIFFSGHHSLFL